MNDVDVTGGDVTRPTLRIVAGGVPTDEELAAVVAVLSSVQRRADSQDPSVIPSRWRAGVRSARSHVRDGWLGAARRSALR